MTPRIPHAIAKELCNILDISNFHEYASVYCTRAVRHDFLRLSQYFATPPKLYKRCEAVVRLESEESQS